MPTILIIGANRGLGLEFARQYADDGWRVVASVRDVKQAADLKKTGVELHACDVTDFRQINTLAQALNGIMLDILLINAGVCPDFGGLADLKRDSFMNAMAVNALAPLQLAKVFLHHMTGPKIIAAISSKMGSMAENSSGGSFAYRASKAALNMGFKSLSMAPETKGMITVLLSPGWVRTDMGGPTAPLDADSSIAGMRTVIAGLTPEDNGRFLHYDGTEIEW